MRKFASVRQLASFTGAVLGILILLLAACSTDPVATQGGSAADSALREQQTTNRRTEQLCHELLHAGTRPGNDASNPKRCE